MFNTLQQTLQQTLRNSLQQDSLQNSSQNSFHNGHAPNNKVLNSANRGQQPKNQPEKTPEKVSKCTPGKLRIWNSPLNVSSDASSDGSSNTAGSLPEREAIRAIHVYDFDNTLFLTPMPNSKIWHLPTLSLLQSSSWLPGGGWWHNPRLLASAGEGLEAEETRAWTGWWNEYIVQLVELSMQQKDALTVLLTGRGVKGYAELIQRMVKSKGLSFDLIVLKPEILPNGVPPKDTFMFKCMFLVDLLNTYTEAQEIKIYEDRVKHVRAFENFAQSAFPSRAHLKVDVIQVAKIFRFLDPMVELVQVQNLINEHNSLSPRPPLRIKKTVYYTGYLLTPTESAYVLNSISFPKTIANEQDVKVLASSVLITRKPATRPLLRKTGPIGRKIKFEIIGVGHWENKVWAALVKPVDPSIQIYSDYTQPVVVLACRRSTRPSEANKITNWVEPPMKDIEFSTIIGEKTLYRIEEEIPGQDGWESLFPKKGKDNGYPTGFAVQNASPAPFQVFSECSNGGKE